MVRGEAMKITRLLIISILGLTSFESWSRDGQNDPQERRRVVSYNTLPPEVIDVNVMDQVFTSITREVSTLNLSDLFCSLKGVPLSISDFGVTRRFKNLLEELGQIKRQAREKVENITKALDDFGQGRKSRKKKKRSSLRRKSIEADYKAQLEKHKTLGKQVNLLTDPDILAPIGLRADFKQLLSPTILAFEIKIAEGGDVLPEWLRDKIDGRMIFTYEIPQEHQAVL